MLHSLAMNEFIISSIFQFQVCHKIASLFRFVGCGFPNWSLYITPSLPFVKEKVTLSYTLLRKWYPFHIATVEKLHLFWFGLFEIF